MLLIAAGFLGSGLRRIICIFMATYRDEHTADDTTSCVGYKKPMYLGSIGKYSTHVCEDAMSRSAL